MAEIRKMVNIRWPLGTTHTNRRSSLNERQVIEWRFISNLQIANSTQNYVVCCALLWWCWWRCSWTYPVWILQCTILIDLWIPSVIYEFTFTQNLVWCVRDKNPTMALRLSQRKCDATITLLLRQNDARCVIVALLLCSVPAGMLQRHMDPEISLIDVSGCCKWITGSGSQE